MASPDLNYDFLAELQRYAPGVVVQREILDGMAAQYAANGYTPLTQAQVLAITGPLPKLPSGLVRLADSNPSPRDKWSIDNPARF